VISQLPEGNLELKKGLSEKSYVIAISKVMGSEAKHDPDAIPKVPILRCKCAFQIEFFPKMARQVKKSRGQTPDPPTSQNQIGKN
jgi:hypothetical protein